MYKVKVAILLIIVMLITACTSSSSMVPEPATEKPNEAGTVVAENTQTETSPIVSEIKGTDQMERVLTISEPAGKTTGLFNPLLIKTEYDREITEILYEPLVEVDPNLNVTPSLAESWDISEDNKTVTFNLRKDVVWHDGKPFTSKDVVFTYDVLAHPDLTTFYGSYATTLKGYEDRKSGLSDHLTGVEAVDEHTVKLTTSEPYGQLLTSLVRQIRIIPEHIWGAIDPATWTERTDLLRNPIGTNCFKFSEFALDEYVILDRFEEYWGGTSNIDRIILRYMTPEATLAGALSGEVDYGRIVPMEPKTISAYDDNGFRIEQIYYNSTQLMSVNLSNELLSDYRVRQAFAHAINRAGIVASLVHGYGKVANQPYREGLFYSPDDSELNLYEYDSEEAIRILTEEVGWEYRDGVMYANGEPVHFTLIYPQGNKARELSAPVIQENLADIGIKIDIEIMEFASLTARLRDGDFDLALLAQGANDPNLIAFYNGNMYDYGGYLNPELEELFLEALRHIDPEEQATYYVQAAKILNHDLPLIYLYHWYDGRFVSDNLLGVQSSALTNFYRLIDWKFK